MTRVRYRVVSFAMALAAVTYLDRVCISVVAPDIMRDLGLSRIQMSYVFSAFTIAYARFEIPTAWWADRIGSRAVLTRIVLWWSAFTLATACAMNYASLLVIRFLFGIGEAGAWPNAAPGVFALDTGSRAWACPRRILRRSPSVRWTDSVAGRVHGDVFALARHLPCVWLSGIRLGGGVVLVVPR